MKYISKLFSNRIFAVAFAVVAQAAWFCFMVWGLSAFSRYIDQFIKVASVAVLLYIINQQMNPAYKLKLCYSNTWINL